MEAIGIAHSVSPRLSAVNSILQYIRQGKVLSSVSVGGDAAEMLEALVDEESLVAGKRVHELGLPKGILLLGVIRGGEAFIPSGQTVIQPQDRIVLLSLREKMSKLEGIVSKCLFFISGCSPFKVASGRALASAVRNTYCGQGFSAHQGRQSSAHARFIRARHCGSTGVRRIS